MRLTTRGYQSADSIIRLTRSRLLFTPCVSSVYIQDAFTPNPKGASMLTSLYIIQHHCYRNAPFFHNTIT